MVHDTTARRKAREMKKKALELARESRALEGIGGVVLLAEEKEAEAARQWERSRELQDKARLEDLTVRQEPLVKRTKKGERTYYRWVASWREDGKCRHVYLGGCRKMGQPEALQNARAMKAKGLGVEAPASCTM